MLGGAVISRQMLMRCRSCTTQIPEIAIIVTLHQFIKQILSINNDLNKLTFDFSYSL